MSRVQIVWANGSRSRLAAREAHKHVTAGDAEIDNEQNVAGLEAYANFIKAQKLVAAAGVAPALPAVPPGYAIEKSAGWFKLLGPDGEQVGQAKREADELLEFIPRDEEE